MPNKTQITTAVTIVALLVLYKKVGPMIGLPSI